jgi:hypothetical protein
MHGNGHYVWGDGRVYKGCYKLDKKDGFGKYRWSDGRIYVGYWKDGKQNGYGKYISNDRTQYGLWENGIRKNWFNEEELNQLKCDEIFFKVYSDNY